MSGDDLDLYVQPSREPKRARVGRRSLAVTSGLSKNFEHAGWAMNIWTQSCAPTFAHHGTNATRFTMGMARRAALALDRTPAHRHRVGHHRRRQPIHLLGVVVVTAVLAAVVQAVRQGDRATALTLSSAALRP